MWLLFSCTVLFVVDLEEVYLFKMEPQLPNWKMKTIICMSLLSYYYFEVTIN